MFAEVSVCLQMCGSVILCRISCDMVTARCITIEGTLSVNCILERKQDLQILQNDTVAMTKVSNAELYCYWHIKQSDTWFGIQLRIVKCHNLTE